jgi:hypothetical protein
MTTLKLRWRTFALLTGALIATAGLMTSKLVADDGGDQGNRRFQHIFFIMMENHATNQIIGNTVDAPFINQLASHYSVALNYHGVTHPSLPNYLAAISGDFQGIWDDCKAGPTETVLTCDPTAPLSELSFVPGAGDATDPAFPPYHDPTSPLYGLVPPQLTAAQIMSAESTPHWFNGKNLVDQLELHGFSWKAYMQSIPATGSTVEYAPTINGTTHKLYAQKHDPFMYFSDIRNDPSRLNKIVPFTDFSADLGGKIPNFVWISPDQCHDMHGVSPSDAAAVGIPTCGYPNSGLDHGAIQLGDAFLKTTVGQIMSSSAWKHKSAIVIAWDEDDYNGYPTGCCGSPVGQGGKILGGALAPAIVITSGEAEHKASNHPYNHYSLLGTIEHLWNLGCLATTCTFNEPDLMLELFSGDE